MVHFTAAVYSVSRQHEPVRAVPILFQRLHQPLPKAPANCGVFAHGFGDGDGLPLVSCDQQFRPADDRPVLDDVVNWSGESVGILTHYAVFIQSIQRFSVHAVSGDEGTQFTGALFRQINERAFAPIWHTGHG